MRKIAKCDIGGRGAQKNVILQCHSVKTFFE